MTSLDKSLPEVGATYLHYKGGRYKVLAIGCLSEDRAQQMVVYQSLRYQTIWIRPVLRNEKCTDGCWNDVVTWPDGKVRPRFVSEDSMNDVQETDYIPNWAEYPELTDVFERGQTKAGRADLRQLLRDARAHALRTKSMEVEEAAEAHEVAGYEAGYSKGHDDGYEKGYDRAKNGFPK